MHVRVDAAHECRHGGADTPNKAGTGPAGHRGRLVDPARRLDQESGLTSAEDFLGLGA